jgi:lipoyl(octanoyl) transferase
MMDQKSNYNIDWLFSKEPVHFSVAFDFMQQRVEKIISGNASQMIWILEHYPVYTAGIGAKEHDLLAKTEIAVLQTNRGGKYTYHGPGIKIIYVMLDLKKFFAPQSPDIRQFVVFLENWVIAILAEFGIKGKIKQNLIGVWLTDKYGAEKKVAALGIKIKKWVSYHGIAININPDLSAFNNIIPCGIKEFGVTSISEILQTKLPEKLLKKSFEELIKTKFETKFETLLL